MIKKELTSTISIALLMAFRMLGMFMILPIFSLQASHIPGATPTLIGIALGSYGLTQAILQIPFGALSDRIGRKPIIAFGLILFIIGSIVAANAHTIYGIIIGRAMQGSGAIGSTCLALLADLTRDQHRSKAMALVGMTIGLSFSIAIVIGPILNHYFALTGIFYTTAILGFLALMLLFTTIASPPSWSNDTDTIKIQRSYKKVLQNKQLLRLDFGIFCQHAMLTSFFVALPFIFSHNLQLSSHQQTITYLIVLGLAFIFSIPLIILAEKYRQMKPVFLSAIATLAITSVLFIFTTTSHLGVTILLFLFFCAFSLLEACLPSLVSKISSIHNKGMAMGVYSTSQFFGIFVGGSAAGWIYGNYATTGVLIFMLTLGVLWLIFASNMAQPPYLSTLIYKAPSHLKQTTKLIDQLKSMNGVFDAVLSTKEQLIYTKVDKKIIDINELRNTIEACSLAKGKTS